MIYSGWELNFFDNSNNFRKYQYDLIKSYLKNYILEIGPGSGKFAKKFLFGKAKKLYLSEINSNLRKLLKKEFKGLNKKVKIISNKINNIRGYFDTICYFDVIEHIKNDRFELLQAFKKLKKNGHLIIIVPANQFLFSNYDRSVGHYRRYNKKFFINFSKKYKLNCKKLHYFDSIGFFFLIINKIIDIKKRPKHAIGLTTLFWNLLVPLSRLIDNLFFYSFGKSLICVYKK